GALEAGGARNPFLKPEHADSWEAGFNVIKQGLLSEQDSLHLKALTYRSRIKDYITSESFLLCSNGGLCKDVANASPDFN
ncbi:TonB-dependent receptor, partial [Klebsiella pneumoniae]|uniref:TonB-dependent receptor domain-containing protein n=1 Tax=Klebsiella pneumoniae TaxID=573 RepID=UPI000D890060